MKKTRTENSWTRGIFIGSVLLFLLTIVYSMRLSSLISNGLSVVDLEEVPPQSQPQLQPQSQPQSQPQPNPASKEQEGGTEIKLEGTDWTDGLDREGIDWTDDIFVRKGWDNDPIVIHSHKLVFFTVPKNACTTFKRLFRRMGGYKSWLEASAHDPKKNGLIYLGHYKRHEQEEIMTSPEWTKAIFVRDPMERTLSAYLDKALKTTHDYWRPPVHGAYIKRNCCVMVPETNKTDMQFDICKASPLWPYETNLTTDNFPFKTFVKKIVKTCPDPHWKPQYKRMSMQNWKYINFVGRFENKKADTHRLLKKIGVFEEFGASGWGKDENGDWTLPIFGGHNLAPQRTNSGSEMGNYYTEEVRKLVSKYYREDYLFRLFNFTSTV